MSEPQFIRSNLAHRVEVAEGGHDATHRSVHGGADIHHSDHELAAMAHAGAAAERNSAATLSASAAQADTAARAGAPKSSQDQPVKDEATVVDHATAATPVAHAHPPEPSHVQQRVQQLKTENDKVRAALERLESARPRDIYPPATF